MYEKLALYRVASDGYLHRHSTELKTLCYKGLLRLNPDIQFLNETFRSFVLDRATDIRVEEWEIDTKYLGSPEVSLVLGLRDH